MACARREVPTEQFPNTLAQERARGWPFRNCRRRESNNVEFLGVADVFEIKAQAKRPLSFRWHEFCRTATRCRLVPAHKRPDIQRLRGRSEERRVGKEFR